MRKYEIKYKNTKENRYKDIRVVKRFNCPFQKKRFNIWFLSFRNYLFAFWVFSFIFLIFVFLSIFFRFEFHASSNLVHKVKHSWYLQGILCLFCIFSLNCLCLYNNRWTMKISLFFVFCFWLMLKFFVFEILLYSMYVWGA